MKEIFSSSRSSDNSTILLKDALIGKISIMNDFKSFLERDLKKEDILMVVEKLLNKLEEEQADEQK